MRKIILRELTLPDFDAWKAADYSAKAVIGAYCCKIELTDYYKQGSISAYKAELVQYYSMGREYIVYLDTYYYPFSDSEEGLKAWYAKVTQAIPLIYYKDLAAVYGTDEIFIEEEKKEDTSKNGDGIIMEGEEDKNDESEDDDEDEDDFDDDETPILK